MTHPDLAARVEAASGADRELDVAVFREIGAPVPFQFANAMVALTYDDAEQCYFAPVGDMRVRYEPPAYTASLDAALTLVPEDYDWAVFRTNGGLTVHAWCGSCNDVFAATPALALTAAALRARATLQPKDRE